MPAPEPHELTCPADAPPGVYTIGGGQPEMLFAVGGEVIAEIDAEWRVNFRPAWVRLRPGVRFTELAALSKCVLRLLDEVYALREVGGGVRP